MKIVFCAVGFRVGLVLLMAYPLQAKRIAPKEVPPVLANGREYSPEGDGRNAFVVATDVRTGTVLWKVKIFHTRIKPWIEEDNQWIFISDLKLAGDKLLIGNEKARCFSLDVHSKRVKREKCDQSPDPANISQRPEPAR